MIKTIIFDLSEVYLQGLIGSSKYIQQKVNVAISDSNLYIPELDELFYGKITEQVYWQAVIKKNLWNVTTEELQKAVRENFKEIKGTREVIEQLENNGYTLALLSNHAQEWIAFCEQKYQYHNLFEAVVYSFEVALSKPDKKFFLHLFNKLHVTAQESVFIDDKIENLQAAKILKMKTIQFTSVNLLKKELIDLGIIL